MNYYVNKELRKNREFLINRIFVSIGKYLNLFTDVTYIRMANYKNLYLSSILDSYNNKIVTKSTVIRKGKHRIINPLNQIKMRRKNCKTIINKDHESIYYSKEYIELFKKYFTIPTNEKKF